MIKIIEDLYLKSRDIVSDGIDESLEYISKIIPLKIHKIPTGTKCWTWVVPEKWSVKAAFIEDLSGKRILDIKNNPLHVLSYSLPINKIVPKEELALHLHTNPNMPEAVPFEFKYYQRDWGFCVQHDKLADFNQKEYKVFIDSNFEKGELKVGEFFVKGKSKKTIVLAGHLCHPFQANDGLSGVAVMIKIAEEISKKDNNYSYRFLMGPETIGSIAYLSQNENIIGDLKYGIFLEMLGNNNDFALQKSRQGNTKIDRIFKYVMKKRLTKFREGEFRKIVGNDEMVFNGPGVDCPMVSISRFPYPEYHTSEDNLKIISQDNLKQAKGLISEVLDILDKDYTPKRKFKGPVFLSGFGLWVDWRVNKKLNENIEQMMLLLEGDKSVFEIAELLETDFYELLEYLDKFFENGLIEKLTL